MNAQKELKLKSYAKINLSLDVTGILDDGYHGVDTVMLQVGLNDDIDLVWEESEDAEGLEIFISANVPYLPTDERNLAYKAAVLLKNESGFEKSGRLGIKMFKRIPVAAGLGGGSGNGAAVLIGLNRLWGLGYDTRKLCDIAGALGADVPFTVLVQNSRYIAALGTGKGEILQPIRTSLRGPVVLAKPKFSVSTKEVFKGIDDCLITERPDTGKLIGALREGKSDEMYPNMINVLECYTLKEYPKVAALKREMSLSFGAEKVLMSGSGPTVYGFFDNYGNARKCCMSLRSKGFEAYWTFIGDDQPRRR